MSIEQLAKLDYDSANRFSISMSNNAKTTTDGKKTGLFTPTNEVLNIALKSVAMVTYSDASVETYVGDHYVISRGREDIKEITLTFNDYGSMTLYKAFENFYRLSQNSYPVEQYFTIILHHDNGKKAPKTVKRTTITLSDCIMTALSATEFSHSVQSEIMDFSVGFKCGDPSYETS
jgi:hypothetical protein